MLFPNLEHISKSHSHVFCYPQKKETCFPAQKNHGAGLGLKANNGPAPKYPSTIQPGLLENFDPFM